MALIYLVYAAGHLEKRSHDNSTMNCWRADKRGFRTRMMICHAQEISSTASLGNYVTPLHVYCWRRSFQMSRDYPIDIQAYYVTTMQGKHNTEFRIGPVQLDLVILESGVQSVYYCKLLISGK